MKAIFKTLVIGIICGNLLLLDFNYKLGVLGFSQAQAQEKEGIKQEASDIKDGNLLATLAMISIGTVASRLVSCKTTPDIIAAAAGGAAFVAGEVLAFAKLKKQLKGYEEYIKNDLSPEELNHQIAIFEKIKEGYEKAIETSNTKVMIQKAAAAAFVVAAGLAVSFYMSVSTALQTCNTALSSAASACYASFAASCVPPSKCYQPFMKAAVGFTKSIPSRVAAFAGYNVPKLSTGAQTEDISVEALASGEDSINAGMCPGGSGVPAVCKGYATLKANFGGVCPAAGLVVSAESIKINDSIHDNLASLKGMSPAFFSALVLKMIASHAQAFDIFGVTASAAVKYIVATAKSVALKIDMFLYNPKNRAILWGILAGLTYAATTSTENVIGELKNRIAKIDEILADLKSRGLGQEIDNKTNTPPVLAGNSGGVPDGVAGKPGSSSSLNSGSDSTVDSKGGSNQFEDISLEGNLPCATKMVNGKCESFEKSFLSSNGYESLDPATKQELMSMAKRMDGINGKSDISSASLESLGKMGENANALNARLAKSNQQIEKIAKANNEADFKATRDGLKNDFLGTVQNELKKNGQSAGGLYASLSGLDAAKNIFGNSNATETAKENVSGMSAEDLALLDKINSLSAQSSLDTSLQVGTSDPSTIDSSVINQTDLDANGKGIDLSKYDLNDISKDKGKNIFDVITNRYQKSGFSRLFPKKKAEVKLEENMTKGE